ncbi:type II toxin-antitoxin system prevent-host-death family antitoxin [Nostocoides sp. F2B08]|nr:type II toxin-antitoxin system prevent-host-death family antitoxin [Tetrasphaera sp. F2B08]
MAMVSVEHAKTHLSALIAAAERGEEVIITRDSLPVVRLVSLGPVAERERGFVPYSVPDSFLGPLACDELAIWEG